MSLLNKDLESTPERLASLACDEDHLKSLTTLWSENHLIHHLAARLLAVLEASKPIAADPNAGGKKAHITFDSLADAVKEVTGGIRMEFSPNTYKGHHAVPFMNFTSLSRIVEMFRNAPPAPAVPVPTVEHQRVILMLLGVCGAAFELADDCCQQEVDGELCHVVPGDSFKKLSDALDEIENTLPDEYEDLPNTVLQWAAVPRHALRAMLQPVKEPYTLLNDWIEHDGNGYPVSVKREEMLFLKTRKQEIKFPYPAGIVKGWNHLGRDTDIIAYKMAIPTKAVSDE